VRAAARGQRGVELDRRDLQRGGQHLLAQQVERGAQLLVGPDGARRGCALLADARAQARLLAHDPAAPVGLEALRRLPSVLR